MYSSRWLIFQFKDEYSLFQVLQNGPYVVNGMILMIREKVCVPCWDWVGGSFTGVVGDTIDRQFSPISCPLLRFSIRSSSSSGLFTSSSTARLTGGRNGGQVHRGININWGFAV
ncbi:hypothetical protein Dimus_017911 [Dionaea muscipula]